MKSQDALIIVDVQNDFCPGGALPIEGGDQVVPILNQWIHAARDGGGVIVVSRDWHPPDHISFREQGGSWPAHCIQGTRGAQWHSGLQLPETVQLIDKGTSSARDAYSAFDQTGLAGRLVGQGIRRLWIGGLAQDVCVLATVLDGCAAGFEVHLICEGTRPVDPIGGRQALQRMRQAGVLLEEGMIGQGR